MTSATSKPPRPPSLPKIGAEVSWRFPVGTFEKDSDKDPNGAIYATFETEALSGLVEGYYEGFIRVVFALELEEEDGSSVLHDNLKAKIDPSWLC